MSSISSVPQPLKNKSQSHPQTAAGPDYAQLVRFLLQPFLESPDSLILDCETNTARVWIRVAFEGEDKGRVFGRGGRNIQAIRTVLTAAAATAGHSVYLDIYGGSQASTTMSDDFETGKIEPTQSRRRETNPPKPVVKPRSPSSLE